MRKLHDLTVCEYYFEYYGHGAAVGQHRAWVDDDRYIIGMRSSMITGNFYRLTLNDDSEIVVSETQVITVEWY